MNPPAWLFVLPGMTTHATAVRAATPPPPASDPLPASPAPSTGIERDVRVKLASLPVPLRVSARDQSNRAILLECDLPWLTLDSPVALELPNGVQTTGRVQSFDIDVTPEGSARLRIFAFLSRPVSPTPTPVAEEVPATPPRAAPPFRFMPLLYLALASFAGCAASNPSALRAIARSAITVIDGLVRRGV